MGSNVVVQVSGKSMSARVKYKCARCLNISCLEKIEKPGPSKPSRTGTRLVVPEKKRTGSIKLAFSCPPIMRFDEICGYVRFTTGSQRVKYMDTGIYKDFIQTKEKL